MSGVAAVQQMKFRSTDQNTNQMAAELEGLSANADSCQLECGAHGVCVGSQCYCQPGYSGSDCSKREPSSEGMTLDDSTVVSSAPQHASAASLSADAANALSTSGSIPYVLLSALSFIGGVVVCIVVQLAYARYKAAEGKKKVDQIFRPLVNSASEI